MNAGDNPKLETPESANATTSTGTGEGEANAASATAAQEETAAAERLAQLEAEKTELRNALIRLQADFDNFRKRVARERHEDGLRHTAHVVELLLPTLDAFERAFADRAGLEADPALRGFELIYRQILDVMTRLGVERIEAQGAHFDARCHQAAERIETAEVPEGTVIAELRAGYRLKDRVLRPSMVRVAVAPTEAPAAGEPKVN
ncbi:MAG TPA: nucleotide exchange factor GrpE [Candidatus Nitrosotenuis sp.]|nr:nucleotide exchange factor GrpE [Candidatus Nitrosotenuis sp.]